MMTRYLLQTVLLALLLSGCAGLSRDITAARKDLREARVEALRSCAELGSAEASLCGEIVEAKERYYVDYERQYARAVRSLVEPRQELRRDPRVQVHAAGQSGDPYRQAFWEARRTAQEATARRAAREALRTQYQGSVARLAVSLRSLSGTLEGHRIATRYLCETRGFGDVQCQRLSSVLAQLDSNASELLIEDIVRAERLLGEGKYDTLLQCGPGDLGAADLGQDTSTGSQGQAAVSQAGLDELRQACGLASRDGGRDGPSGGFSGISGVGDLGGGCGLGAAINDPSEVLRAMISTMTQLADACEGTSTIAPYAGGGGRWEYPSGEAIQPPGALAGQVHDIDLDDRGSLTPGGGTPGTTTGSEGDQLNTWFRDDFGDGHTQMVNVVTDAAGDVIWIEAEANYPDGTKSTYSYELDKQEGYERQTYSSTKTGISQTSTYYANGTETHEFSNQNTGEAYSASADASGNTEYNDTDGNRITTDADGNVTSWTKNGTVIVSSSSCADPDLCGSCNSAAGAYVKASMECAGGMGSSYPCSEFLESQSCCQSSNAPGADPRIAMPTPDGDVACVGGQGPSRESQCQTFCGVASSDIDCTANCLQDRPTVAGGATSFLTRVCLYALSESCFGGSMGISPGFGKSGPVGGGGPPPPVSAGGLVFGPLGFP